jgi:hypothetical protein
MNSREPFFEPPLAPVDEGQDDQPRFANHPWSPPINVVPVIIPVETDVIATPQVVIRVHDIQAYDRGMLLRVESWVHPEAAPRPADVHYLHEEPRVGLLLGDGTKLGAPADGPTPDMAAPEPGTVVPIFAPTGGISGELRASQSVWVSPVPDGTAELVVAWEALDVPETFLALDLDAVRAASRGARELWSVPDADLEQGGWFAYAPGGHTAYKPSLTLPMDDDGEG